MPMAIEEKQKNTLQNFSAKTTWAGRQFPATLLYSDSRPGDENTGNVLRRVPATEIDPVSGRFGFESIQVPPVRCTDAAKPTHGLTRIIVYNGQADIVRPGCPGMRFVRAIIVAGEESFPTACVQQKRHGRYGVRSPKLYSGRLALQNAADGGAETVRSENGF